MSSILPERLQEGRERILKCLYELDLDVDQFVPIETLYRSYARLFGVRFDHEECFKYFETRDRVLAIQRFFPRWIFYAVKFENNVVSRLILTRQKFIKVKEDSSDGELAVFSTPVREYSPVTAKKIPLTSDRAYLQKIASRSKETETSHHFPVKNNIQCDLTENNSGLSNAPFKTRKPNDALYSTQKQYVPLNQLKITPSGMTEDSFCSIVKETTNSVPNRSKFNQYRNSTNRNRNVTRYDGITEVSKSGFVPLARPALKPLIRCDPPKSLMELTGLPSGLTHSGIASPPISHERVLDSSELPRIKRSPNVPDGFNQRTRKMSKKKSPGRSRSLDEKKRIYTTGTTENGEIYSSDNSDA
ncbi:hypothetical protein FO519_007666 [Halicephalobus sp. NKZ332]|nr:hypothetical protein FO519_007666 [Halicephalobus sp. NKZ332]